MVFDNPPVVELIAELRWLPAGVTMAADKAANIQVPSGFFMGAQPDSMFMTFGAGVTGDGYSQIERLMLAGMPPIPFQPVYRYSKPPTSNDGRSLYHLGAGIFSAHITPPYKSWSDFRPVILRGVRSLLTSRTEAERHESFLSATVRYIDAFTAKFVGGYSSGSFMSKVLGIEVTVPNVIRDLVQDGRDIAPQLRLVIPVKGGFQMTLGIADGQVNSTDALIMDTSLGTETKVSPDEGAIMRAFDAAHDILSPTFVKMTSAIHDKMELRS